MDVLNEVFKFCMLLRMLMEVFRLETLLMLLVLLVAFVRRENSSAAFW